MTTKKLSPRAARALEILKAGGKFRYGLTTGWKGIEKFKWSLHGKLGGTYSGYGHATFYELERSGVEFDRMASGFTGSAAYFTLKETA